MLGRPLGLYFEAGPFWGTSRPYLRAAELREGCGAFRGGLFDSAVDWGQEEPFCGSSLLPLLCYWAGTTTVCPLLTVMCEMVVPPYTSAPVLFSPVTGIVAAETVDPAGMLMLMVGLDPPT